MCVGALLKESADDLLALLAGELGLLFGDGETGEKQENNCQQAQSN